ncbi:5'-nucleotidase C-terminal domain-containing protein [Micrococcales bacterium 31B]|nr:5'-nucleotidase C-terminal domain-containing protein [Micrococcales bacterium 31B]
MRKTTRAPSRRILGATTVTLLAGSLLTALTGAFASPAAAAVLVEPIGAPNANSASCTPAGQEATNTDVHLIGINDFHGRINNNTVQFAGVVEGLKSKYGAANSVVVSSGDNIGASLFSSSLQFDAPTIDILNTLGVSGSAMGNHEFDKGFYPGSGQPGLDFTTRVLNGESTGEGADYPAVKPTFPYLAANAYKAGTTEQIVPGHTVVEAGGVRIAVIGAITEETPNLVSKGALTGVEFGDPVDAVNAEVAKIKAAGDADIIIADYHEGAPSGTPQGATLEQVQAQSPVFNKIVTETDPAVSAIFTAHTHMLYAWDAPNGATTRPIIQTQSYGAYLGNVCLSVNTTTHAVTGHWAENVAVPATPSDAAAAAAADKAITDAFPAAASVKTIVDNAISTAAVAGEQVVGKINADLTRPSATGTFGADGTYSAPGYGDRTMTSTMGNLVTTALQAQLQPEGVDPIITMANPGGIRTDLLAGDNGDVTFADANAVLPFLNNLWTVSLTGAQLKTVLEQQWQTDANGTATGAYLQLALSPNVRYTYDPGKAWGQRIQQIWVNGKPLDGNAKYTVGTFNFLAQGGDNFWEFQKATDVKDTGLIDRDAWMAYFAANQTAGITPDPSQRAFAVTTPVPTSGQQGATVAFDIADLQPRSAGVPLVTKVDAYLGGTLVGSANTSNATLAASGAPIGAVNQAKLSITVPAALAAGDTTLELRGVSAACPAGCALLTTPFRVVAKTVAPTVYSYPFTDDLYVVEGTGAATRARKLTFEQWVAYGAPQPVPAPVAYVRYPWSDGIAAVTFWNTAPEAWLWQPLGFDQWVRAGAPRATNAGWIQGTTVAKYATSDELFATYDGDLHKLTFAEWQAMNYVAPTVAGDAGFIKFPWSDAVFTMTSIASGSGSQLSAAQWAALQYPTPRVQTSVAGGQFVKFASGDRVYFRATRLGAADMYITYEQWKAAGFPAVTTVSQ